MTDVIDRLKKLAPSDIDKFQNDIERRAGLGDDFINDFLSNTFLSLNKDNLPPSQSHAWELISRRLRSP